VMPRLALPYFILQPVCNSRYPLRFALITGFGRGL